MEHGIADEIYMRRMDTYQNLPLLDLQLLSPDHAGEKVPGLPSCTTK